MRSPSILAATLALAAPLAAAPAAARDCYRAANAAYSADRFDEAGRLFAASAADPACATSKVRLLISAGEAFRRGAERTADAEGYCRAADAYQQAAKLADRKRLADIATAGAEATVVHCLAPEPAPVAVAPEPVAPEPVAPEPPPPPAEPAEAPPMPPPRPPPTDDDDDMTMVWVVGGIAAGAAIGIGVAWLLIAEGDEPTRRSNLVFTPE